jgi:hypothetical protein
MVPKFAVVFMRTTPPRNALSKVAQTVLSPEEIEEWKDDPELIIMKFLKKYGMKNIEDVFKTLRDEIDPRDFALKYWGWKRIHGNSIQTQYLTSRDLDTIIRGLNDILQDEEDENELFDIEVNATHNLYIDVPLSILEEKNLMSLRNYKRY